VAKDLKSIPKADVKRILGRIDALQFEPFPENSKKLVGREAYRIRQGVYRILYAVDDEIVTINIIKVVHRKDAYRP